MKTRLFSLTAFFFLLFQSTVFAQVPVKQWDFSYGGFLSDGIEAIDQTSDGGYILGGNSISGAFGDKSQPSKGGNDYWIIKIDGNGVKQWDASFGGSSDDWLTAIRQSNDGGYILGGYSASPASGDKSQNPWGENDFWVVKINSSGIKEWDFRYGGINDERLEALEQTNDGGYILGGFSESGISGDKTQASQGLDDFWIVKINASGIKEWDYRYGGTANDDIFDLIQSSDGGFVLAGNSGSDVSGDKTQPHWGGGDFWVVKTDANGSIQWDARFGGTSFEYASEIIETTAGGYLVGGSSISEVSGDVTQEPRKGGNDYWIVRITAEGLKQWDARFGGKSGENLIRLSQTSDGNYVAGGYSWSDDDGDKSQPSQGDSDFWIVKFDDDGAKIWDVRFGGSESEFFADLIETADGGLLLAGTSSSPISGDKSQSNTGPFAAQDFWILKTDAGGTLTCDIPSGTFTSNITSTSAKTNWNVVGSANKYKVRYRITGSDTWTKVSATSNYKKLKDLLPNTEYDWQVKSICSDLNLENSDWSSTQNFIAKPLKLAMEEEITFEVYPNPFSSSTTISFSLEENSHTTIELFDLAGRKIKTVRDENAEVGNHEVQLNREKLSVGIYFLQMKTDNVMVMKKVVIE